MSEPTTLMALPLEEIDKVNIVDIGAMMLGTKEEPYRPLLDIGKASVVGFEPNGAECAKLNAAGDGRFYPYFLGDGTVRTYHQTNRTMSGSLYPPNSALLAKFHYLDELMTPVKEHPGIQTRRLDDLAELGGLDDIDLIKIDVQGAELDVFRGASQALASCVVIIVEVAFVELYIGQPVYSDVDRYLRDRGFQFHTFKSFGQRFFKPFSATNDPEAAFRQLLWADAVFVRDFMHFEKLSDAKLLKFALILGQVLGSYDLASLALAELDRRHGTSRLGDYVNRVIAQHRSAQKVPA